MAITIKDIAKEAGVSLGTVSNMINKSAKVSKELSDRIEELTKKATSDALKSLGVPSSNDNSKKNSTESLKNLKNLFN